MTPVDWRDYIIADERILAGKPIVKGTRLSVEFVLELLAAGWDRDALRDSYPQLTEDHIRAVASYFTVASPGQVRQKTLSRIVDPET